MEHTHEYDCIVCGAHFDNMKDLDRHNHQEHVHSHGAQSSASANEAQPDHRTEPSSSDRRRE
jgi:hypothetical protein